MGNDYKPIDLSRIRTYSLSERKSKVSEALFAKTYQAGSSFQDFIDTLPDILAGSDLRQVVSCLATAFLKKKIRVWAMGAHVIKVGLNPVVVDLMERGVVSALALNGAGIIHDLEIAMTGSTSEDVAEALDSGDFGMARETCEFLGEAIQTAGNHSMGLGEAVGRAIIAKRLPRREHSILAAGARLGIPVTVHVAIGTDILHMHPGFDPEKAGGATHRDFRIFASIISRLQGGVYLNIGSAVILPEIFLKAVSIARNLGHELENFTTVNMDFIRQYRPLTNVVHRPTARGGKGINLVGHHEILLPLIAAGVIERIGKDSNLRDRLPADSQDKGKKT
ncbi:MAG: hypothetical protein Q8P24_07815 [Desulfobacterales bacterium]|nr:hypothetical protein [Desulfobacterales bacterium]